MAAGPDVGSRPVHSDLIGMDDYLGRPLLVTPNPLLHELSEVLGELDDQTAAMGANAAAPAARQQTVPEQGLQPPELHGDGRLAAPNRLCGSGETPCLCGTEGTAEQVGIDRAWTYHKIGIDDTDHQHNSFPGLVRRLYSSDRATTQER